MKRKTASTLTRCQAYLRDNPLPAWLFTISLLSAALTAANYLVPMIRVNRTIYTCFIFIQPTIALAMRSSDKARQYQAFPAIQERIMGWIAACAAAVSVASVGSFFVYRLIGAKFGDGIFVLMGSFVFSAFFAMAMGYVARRTKAGYWSAVIATCLFLLVVAAEFLAMIIWWLR